jgi:hypothetical protein
MPERIAEPEETSIARQRLGKHIPAAMDVHATTEEMLETAFSMRSVQKLYEDQWDHPDDVKQLYCRLLTTQSRNNAQYYY